MQKLVAILILFWTAVGMAQVSPAGPNEAAVLTEAKVLGWNKKMILGGSLSFGSSENVIGQPNGQSNNYGLNIEGSLNKISEHSEWRNSLKIGESASRTPAIPRFVKVKDEIKIETMFLRELEGTPWFGPYVKASVQTAIFSGEDVRSEVKTYQFDDGTTLTGTSVHLTDGFKPLVSKESVGGFFKIINKENMKLEARSGLGAVQVNAANQRAIKDDSGTSNIEVINLYSYEQAGFEGGLALNGAFDKKTSYSLEGEFLVPLITNKKSGDTRSDFELTNWEVKGRLTSKLYDWLSLDYTTKIFRQPQLLDSTQLQTLFLLNLTYQLL